MQRDDNIPVCTQEAGTDSSTVRKNLKLYIDPDNFEKLVVELKKIPHGRVTIFMQDGKPVRIEKDISGDFYFGIESIKL